MKNQIIKAKALLDDAGNLSSGSEDFKRYKANKNNRYIRIKLDREEQSLERSQESSGVLYDVDQTITPSENMNDEVETRSENLLVRKGAVNMDKIEK